MPQATPLFTTPLHVLFISEWQKEIVLDHHARYGLVLSPHSVSYLFFPPSF